MISVEYDEGPMLSYCLHRFCHLEMNTSTHEEYPFILIRLFLKFNIILGLLREIWVADDADVAIANKGVTGEDLFKN
ncbi:hypothetical protein RJT34_15445 [Clitoria ternatea]|uniref:Uncharacterized protein n=1 Tax=Clitoria ternatea TaxID=43366 RepID=A0AAN9PCR6_CLITE